MAGNRRRHSAIGTRVPSARVGMRLAGGSVPCVAHASMASSMARNSIEVATTLSISRQIPRSAVFSIGSAKCCELDHR
jgi:hypothetical protein